MTGCHDCRPGRGAHLLRTWPPGGSSSVSAPRRLPVLCLGARAEGCAPSCRQGVQPSGRRQQDAWLLQQPNVVKTKAMDGIVCLANGLERQRVCMGSDNTSHGLQFLKPRSSMAATDMHMRRGSN